MNAGARAWVAVLAALLARGAWAQGDADAAPPPHTESDQPSAASSMEVAANLWAVIGRYRFAATADQVRVTLVSRDGGSDMHSLVVRCVPGAAGLARLELGDLVLVARGGRLRAVHRRDPTTYAEIEAPEGTGDPASVLRALLPPLAISQLSLAFDTAEVDWCPLVAGLRWEHAERIEIDGRDGVRLDGVTDVGRASLELAAARVRHFEADLEPGGATRLIVDCEPLEPDDPSGWVIDVSGRRMVSGLGALRPLGAPIGVGDRLPRPSVVTHDTGREMRLGDDTGRGGSPETRLYAVLFIRDDTPPEITKAGVIAVLHGATEFQRELLRGRIDGRFDLRVRLADLYGVVQARTSGGILERIEAQAGAWGEAVEAARPVESERPELAWAGGESRLIDRLVPGASMVLVLHDGTGEILSILGVDDHTTAQGLAAGLTAGVPDARTP